MERLNVWAEHIEGFVLAGVLAFDPEDGEHFTYDDSYLDRQDAKPLYPVLPLRAGVFGTQQTRAAFSSLGPEGLVGHDIRTALRAGRDAITPVLAKLDHETVGALTFTQEGEEPDHTHNTSADIGPSFLEQFAANPEQLALETLLESRLSLNGAVAKIGVTAREDGWRLPLGLAPSTHILKVGSPVFPGQMLNEALCMRCALTCGFDDAAQTSLILIDGQSPILVSKRFDRTIIDDRPAGLPKTMRLHQADFCQLLGISVDALKYTPSDELVESYTTSVASMVSQESSERYGDRSYIFDVQVFNYLVGNCDNHLKNLSITWDSNWRSKAVSPIYDVTCTTVYEGLSRDMGMGIGRHRGIDDIEPDDFRLMARQLGTNWRQVRNSMSQMAEGFTEGLMAAAHDLEQEYGIAAVKLAERLLEESRDRIEVAKQASLL